MFGKEANCELHYYERLWQSYSFTEKLYKNQKAISYSSDVVHNKYSCSNITHLRTA